MKYTMLLLALVCLSTSMFSVGAFQVQPVKSKTTSSSALAAASGDGLDQARRSLFEGAAGFALMIPSVSFAEDGPSLDTYLYRVLRAREATTQERRLITTGKFQDVQRANVKLAVGFIVRNYRLSDAVNSAAAFLKGQQQMAAVDAGQSAVQNLQTILEYFDSSDVQNLKVGSNTMAGKETLVLKGLEATQLKLDEFITFFPADTVDKIKQQINDENDLNKKEFDPTLGTIVNLAPQKPQ